ncbi:glycoside hydrolase family 32 protein [Bacillus sp. 1P06AnD]|uniref:glycoside hydrolase family 32 protein n=1 Tax=Bacillus sp. 1P06AnD TaxID=3132208 RepID=UPI00399FC4BA
MEWTRELRYRTIEQAAPEEWKALKDSVEACGWRQTFHVQPPTGLLNDPNGFSFFNGEYHLFYQWFPLGPVHGLKYWYHTKSKDLVHWENLGVGISPGHYYDSHGAYSGSAIEHEGKLKIVYTGNVRNDEWERFPYQVMASMDETGHITKDDQAIIEEVPRGYTDHFRDPKIWKDNDSFYMIIGAQREDETGCAVIYQSIDLQTWTLLGEMGTDYLNFGFMWECPDYMEIGEKGLFIFSPQGLEPKGDHFQNIYQSGYLLGEPMNLPDIDFQHGTFCELDRGFDFYAPQTMETPDGRRILVGWMGLPEIEYPTDSHGWAHCLTVPRELTVLNGKLYQNPVEELQSLRSDEKKVSGTVQNDDASHEGFSGDVYEMVCEMASDSADRFGIEFRCGKENGTVLLYDRIEKRIILDRSRNGQLFAEEYGTHRACSLEGANIKFHLFVDRSSVEVFINDGEEVFTARIFPDPEDTGISFFAQNGTASYEATKWNYK